MTSLLLPLRGNPQAVSSLFLYFSCIGLGVSGLSCWIVDLLVYHDRPLRP
jgi:hypothetical protein